jgi:hypothetical protein
VAGLRAALGGFCDDRINSIAGPNPHKGASRGTPDFVSQDTGRWALHLLQRGRPERPPTLLLLHGFPSSSRMFEPLVARLSDRYHLVAPDYPGFGHSDCPDPKKFAYTFDHIAEIMNHFTEALGLSRYTLYSTRFMTALRTPGTGNTATFTESSWRPITSIPKGRRSIWAPSASLTKLMTASSPTRLACCRG